MSEFAISPAGDLPREKHESFLNDFQSDLLRHFVYVPNITLGKKVALCLQVEGIWACFVYRFGRALKMCPLPPLVSHLARFLHGFLEIVVRIATGIHLDVEARIGPGLYIGHHGSVFVGPGVCIGPTSSVGQMAYVGAAAIGLRAPVLGERCFVGAGAKVIGPVALGDEVAVGAGAVVLEDVPAKAVVVGNPARIVSYKGTSDVIYLGRGAVPLTGQRTLTRSSRS